MHFELSDEQELFATSLREWLGERAGSASVRGWLDTGDSAAFERLFVGDGWASVGFNEDLGGQGGGLLELALTARESGRAAAPGGPVARGGGRGVGGGGGGGGRGGGGPGASWAPLGRGGYWCPQP